MQVLARVMIRDWIPSCHVEWDVRILPFFEPHVLRPARRRPKYSAECPAPVKLSDASARSQRKAEHCQNAHKRQVKIPQSIRSCTLQFQSPNIDSRTTAICLNSMSLSTLSHQFLAPAFQRKRRLSRSGASKKPPSATRRLPAPSCLGRH